MKTTMLLFLTLLFSALCSNAYAEESFELGIKFKLRSLSGKVQVSVKPNENPIKYGYETLFGKESPLLRAENFPICTAIIDYEGNSYNAIMGWIQIVTITNKSEPKKKTVVVDMAPQMKGSVSPYVFWGHLPVLFDAPSMLTSEGKVKPNIEWRADSFLAASPDALMTKRVQPIMSFSWGYSTDSKGMVTIHKPKDTKLKPWFEIKKMLEKDYPDWTFL